MRTDTLDWTSKLFRYVLLLAAVSYIVVYLIIVFLRIGYPFGLEYMEEGSVTHVMRLLSGEQIYVSPSLEFVPFIYGPLYYYVSAVVCKILGIGFMPLRLVSFISSLGCFLIIFLIVKRETKSAFSGILASCLFAATFRISGAWFDVARVDSLFLLFLLGAIYIIKFETSWKSYVLAGIFLSFSFLTKQTALGISLPIMLYCVLSNRRASIFLIGTVVTILGISTLLLNYTHDGWYNYYVIFDVRRQYSINKSMLGNFWLTDLMSPLAIACVMSIFYMFVQLLNSKNKNVLFYCLAAIGMVGGTWISKLHSGAYSNVLFPAYAIISILFGLATHTTLELIRTSSLNKPKIMEIYVYLICIIQFACLVYNPRAQIPSREDLEAGKRFINTMARMEGDILVPYHPYLTVLAGKKSYAHGGPVRDVATTSEKQVREKLVKEVVQAIEEKRFSAIILDLPWFIYNVEEHYMRERPVFTSETGFWTVTGLRTRPHFIYVPKNNDTH